jgi:hypothetical protein
MDKKILSLIAITVLLCGLVFADSTPPITEVSVSQVPYIGESFVNIECDPIDECLNFNYKFNDNGWNSFNYKITTDLSSTDTGNWIGTDHIYGLTNYNGKIYLGLTSGKFGVYDIDTNVLTDLSSTDTGNWIGTDHIYGLTNYNGKIYLGLTSGKFGVYDIDTNVLTDLSSTDTGNWIGTNFINGLIALNNKIYLGLTNGKFGVYDIDTNVLTDLSSTDTGNWIGEDNIHALVSSNGKIYLGLSNGKFGVYDPNTNITTDLSSTDTGNWIGTNFIYGLIALNNKIYLGLTNGKFGVYDIDTNVLTDLSSTDTGNWIGTDHIYGLTNYNGKIYLGLTSGKFGVYDIDTNVLTDLSSTDTGNWIGISYINEFTSYNNKIYIGGFDGKFGVYDPTNFHYIIFSIIGQNIVEYYSTNIYNVDENHRFFDFNTYGSLQFRTFDQNAIADIDGVTINVDGTDYNAIANSWFAYDLEGITTNTTKTFTFSKTGYSNAIYQIDVNEFYDQPEDYFDISLAPTSLSSTVPFKFYKPDGVTLYSNVYAELINTSLDRRIGRIKTNSLGEATFNMIKTDNNYNQILNNGEVTYNPVALTILYPKDEQSQTDITGNWKARTSINYVYSDNNIPASTNKTIYILPNTKYAHKISIQDIAENYFERTWDLLYTGNPLTDILQPYLIDADDGTAVTFVFQNPKRDSMENVIVNIYDNILGERTLVTSGSSDITGNALFFLIANKTYELEFIYNGVTILSTTNYTVTTNKVYWTIDLTGQEIKKIDQSYFNIRWTPFVDYTSSDTLNLGYVATGKNINYTSVNFYKLNTDGTKTITHTYQKSCTTPCTVSVPLTDVNISSGNIYADANIYSDSNTVYFTYTKRWSAGTEKSINTQNLFINARRSFGCSIDTAIPCPLTNITAVIIMILVLGGIVFKFNFSNPKGLLVIGLGILGVFTYLGWFWWIPLVLMIIGSIFYLRRDN